MSLRCMVSSSPSTVWPFTRTFPNCMTRPSIFAIAALRVAIPSCRRASARRNDATSSFTASCRLILFGGKFPLSSRRTGDTILFQRRSNTSASMPSAKSLEALASKLAKALQRTIQSCFTMEHRKRGAQSLKAQSFARSPCFGSAIATGQGGWIGPHWILEDSTLEYECGICFQIMEQPTSGRSEEGHVCCRACYETHLKRQKKCPSCRAPASIVRLRFNRPLANLIAKLRVRCKHAAWTLNAANRRNWCILKVACLLNTPESRRYWLSLSMFKRSIATQTLPISPPDAEAGAGRLASSRS